MSYKPPRYEDFLIIQKKLEEKTPVQVFEIGGTYLQGYINTIFTRDIDIVIVIRSSASNIGEKVDLILGDLDYKRVSTTTKDYIRFQNREGLKLDVFLNKVFMFTITPSMLSRVKKKKLTPEDVFLLKAQSTRGLDKDFSDLKNIISLISKGKFNYQTILQELEEQLKNHIKKTSQNVNRLLVILEAIEQLNEIFPDIMPF